jgi:hypothetical protein
VPGGVGADVDDEVDAGDERRRPRGDEP